MHDGGDPWVLLGLGALEMASNDWPARRVIPLHVVMCGSKRDQGLEPNREPNSRVY